MVIEYLGFQMKKKSSQEMTTFYFVQLLN